MKRLTLATIALTSFLVYIGVSGCGGGGGGSSSTTNTTIDTNTTDTNTTINHPPISFENVKRGDLFYYLGKPTNLNDPSLYPTLGFNYSLIVIDMEDSTETEISQLQTNGKFVVCYVDAGTWEGWRSDAALFPEETKGLADEGWADEQWLDITNPTVLSLIEKRIDRTAEKGCDGIEFDNIDGWSPSNNTGFTITAQQQITFNTTIAQYAHSKNLITAFKTDVEQIADLEPYFDMAINESCHFYGECNKYENFAQSKPVFDIEYIDGTDVNATAITPPNLHAQTDFFKSYLSNIALDGTYYVKLPLP